MRPCSLELQRPRELEQVYFSKLELEVGLQLNLELERELELGSELELELELELTPVRELHFRQALESRAWPSFRCTSSQVNRLKPF